MKYYYSINAINNSDVAVIINCTIVLPAIKQRIINRTFHALIHRRSGNGRMYGIRLPENNRIRLEANKKEYTAYMYENANHGFHNDTTPRYDKAAAELEQKVIKLQEVGHVSGEFKTEMVKLIDQMRMTA